MTYFFLVIKKELMEVVRDKGSLIMSLVMMLIIPFMLIGYGFQQKGSNNVVIAESAKEMYIFCEKLEIAYERVKDEEVLTKIQNREACLGILYEAGKFNIIFDETSESALHILNKINSSSSMHIQFSEIKYREIIYRGISDYLNDDNNLLTIILPTFLVFSIMTGTGNSIAFNIFTGEKERGSMEALLLTQIKRNILYCAKLTVVATVMLIGAILYLLVIFGAFKTINNMNIITVKFPMLSGMNCFYIVIILITFSLLVASCICNISLRARNIREAQLRTMLLSFLICGIGVGMGLNLENINENIIMFVPAVNTIQVLSNLFGCNIDIPFWFVTNVSNLIYTIMNIKIGIIMMRGIGEKI